MVVRAMLAGMKVLLVNPCDLHLDEVRQKCYPPLNLMYLAAALREAGHRLAVLDANAHGMQPAAIAEHAAGLEPQLVGIPLLSETACQVNHIAGAIGRRLPDARIVLGGPTATAQPARSLQEIAAADFLIAGEGERPLTRLCNALDRGGDVSRIAGLAWRREGEVRVQAPAPPEKNPDRFPLPARDLLAREYSAGLYYTLLVRDRPTETLTTTRGCPCRCAFCYNTIRRFRRRSVPSVMEEIVSIRDRGIRHIEFVDDSFTLDRDHAMAVLDAIIRERLDLRLVIKSRSDSVDEALLQTARRAGVYQISYGMESGVQDMLDRMCKGITVADNERANRLTLAAGIRSHTSWLLCFPGETPETLQRTIEFIVRLRPSTANFGVFRPYPGTEAYETARAEDTLVGDWSVHDERFPWVRLPWAHSRADLQRWLRRAQRRLYLRPHYALQFAGDILSEANLTMARYAWQEALKLLRGVG